jgi:4a-hydroxytetrahydrobiopterin dehydratase
VVGYDPGMSLSRRELSDAVSGLGWRYVLGSLCATVAVTSLAEAAELAVRLAGDAGDGLFVDVRPSAALLRLRSPDGGRVTAAEVVTADRIAGLLAGLGRRLEPGLEGVRSVQMVEIAIDAIDIPRVRPFWRAVMGYGEDPGDPGSLVDPLGQGLPICFQQMDQPRLQRNRIHLDVSVPHDEAERRVEAALEAGGRLVSDRHAPAFWVLSDPEGNEACVCSWQGRDAGSGSAPIST